MYTSFDLRSYAEQLEKRVAMLKEERDQYDLRRCEAIKKVEEWRLKCRELEAKVHEFESHKEKVV